MRHATGVLSAVMFAAYAAFAASPAQAEYPEKTIRILSPYSAGGGTDIVARAIGSRLSERLGQSVIVENVTGAAGTIATKELADSPADGYTILIDAVGIAINPSVYDTPYNAQEDLAPIARVANLPFVLVVNPNVEAQTVQEFIDLAKAKPGELRAAAPGNSTRMAGELFAMQTDVEFNFIPYRGGAAANVALLSGEVDVIFSDLPSVSSYITSGEMRALGISSPEPWATFPDIPLLQKSGAPEYDAMTWYAMFAPGGTPQEILDLLNNEITEIVHEPAMVEQLKLMGAAPVNEGADQFKQFFHSELDRWAEVNKVAGLKAE